jgi:hypothetical protein
MCTNLLVQEEDDGNGNGSNEINSDALEADECVEVTCGKEVSSCEADAACTRLLDSVGGQSMALQQASNNAVFATLQTCVSGCGGPKLPDLDGGHGGGGGGGHDDGRNVNLGANDDDVSAVSHHGSEGGGDDDGNTGGGGGGGGGRGGRSRVAGLVVAALVVGVVALAVACKRSGSGVAFGGGGGSHALFVNPLSDPLTKYED